MSVPQQTSAVRRARVHDLRFFPIYWKISLRHLRANAVGRDSVTARGRHLHSGGNGDRGEPAHLRPWRVPDDGDVCNARGIDTIALGGFLTNCCVESTMRTGYEKGYNVITLNDCTASLSDEEQWVATEKTYPMFSHQMNHDGFLKELAGEKSGAAMAGQGIARN